MEWFELKQYLSDATGLSKDALHIHAAVLLHIGAALVLKSSLARPVPWLIVLLAALANEWSDLRLEIWPDRSEQYRNGLHDLWNTMLVPTLLLFVSRFLPRLFELKPGGGSQ